jgi:hypothetical protein
MLTTVIVGSSNTFAFKGTWSRRAATGKYT